MSRSLFVGVLALVSFAFALAPGELPAALTDLPPDVASAITVQYWITNDGQVVHTPTPQDVEKLVESGRLAAPLAEVGAPSAGGASIDQIEEHAWPFHGQNLYQTWYNKIQPQQNPVLRWSQVGAGSAWAPWYGYPTSADGKVLYVDCYNGTVYCRDIDDGTLIWSYKLQANSFYPGTPTIFEGPGGELRVAINHYNDVSTSIDTPYMSCFRLSDGNPVWLRKALPKVPGTANTNNNLGRPVYYNGYIYHTVYNNASPYTGGALVRVNAATGDTTRLYQSTLGTGSAIAPITVDEGGQYCYMVLNNMSVTNTWIVKLNLATGAQVAATPAQTNKLRGSAALNPTTRRLFVEGSAATSGAGYIYCYNADNLGAGPVWSTPTTGGHDIQYTAIDQENVYVCTQATPGRLYAVKQADGTSAWGGNTYRDIPGSGPIYDGGVCVTGEVGGNRYLYLTPGYYNGGWLWVVNAATGATVQSVQVSTSLQMFTGAARPFGYFLSKAGYGTVYCWESPNDITYRKNVAMTAILVPIGVVDSGVSVTPTVVVQNKGQEVVDSFDVHIDIDFLSDQLFRESTYVLDLAPGIADTVEFGAWVPQARDSLALTTWTWFADDENSGDDTLRSRFLVRVRDVAVTDVTPTPPETLDAGVVIYPQCQVGNKGNQSQTFNVEFRIGSYTSMATVSNLIPGGSRPMTAPNPYTTMPGAWVHRVEAVMSGDLHPEDNVMLDTFWVRGTVQHDVAAEAIVSPVGNIDTINTVHVRARVANYGGENELFWSWFSVTDTATDKLVYKESLQVSLPGGAFTTVSYPDTVFKVLGAHATRCSVYVAGDQNVLNNVVTGSFQATATQHNVLVQEILSPSGSVDSASTVTPSAVVRNAGSETETFNAYFQIGTYLGTTNVPNLAAGATRTLTFPDWTANTKDTVLATAWTYLVGDENRADDTLSQKFFVAVHDVGVKQITVPVDTVPDGQDIHPQCVVKNYGSATETFDVRFRIGLYDATETVTDLDPGQVDTVDMSTLYTTQVGVWLDRVSTLLTGDQRPGNNQMLDTFWVLGTLNHDVGVDEILEPSGTIDTLTRVTPKVKVANYGQNTETWKTWFQIYDPTTDVLVYDEEQETTLPGQASVVLEYPDTLFHVVGTYTNRCSTYLATDQNMTNDVGTSEFEVGGVTTWPAGWKEMKSVPQPLSNKPVKNGGWLAIDGAGTIYAGKGYKTADFYSYDAIHNTWAMLETIPSLEDGRVKLPYKGSRGVSDGGNYVYMVKGNNTLGFWRYDVTEDTWERMASVPEGPDRKRVKGGTDMVYLDKDDTGYVYLMKGYRTEFYRYNVQANRWEMLNNVPYGVRAKYDKGSWLCYVPGSPSPPYPFPVLYAHQAKYYDKSASYLRHNMFLYDVDGDTWFSQKLKGMPVYGFHGGRPNKKKKSKDGGSGAVFGQDIYALKGGNTQQFFRFNAEGDTWYELDTMPGNGSYGRKKYVKYGAYIVSYGYGAFFALKGNKTYEFWRYVLPHDVGAGQERGGAMAGNVGVRTTKFEVFPNPIASGLATVRLSLPKAGPVAVTVFDIAGRAVLRHSAVCNLRSTVSLDLRKVAAGVYLVRLDAEGYTATQKLVVARQ